jgi:hypothetical protein
MVSMTQRNFILLLVGVCVLSAGIGSGLALLAQTGPSGAEGARGPAGPRGPQGPEGPSGAAEVEGLEAEVQELRGEVENSGELEGRLESLEDEISGLSGSGSPSEICEELELPC